MTTTNKYKQNLKIDGNKVISYLTHVATIDFKNNTVTELSYWSMTTRKHVNYVGQFLQMEVKHYC